MSNSVQTIRDAFISLRRDKKIRHRDIAEKLQLSEGELIAAHIGIETNTILHAIRLRSNWPNIVASLEPLGEVMALTRNASCVHEKTGIYRNVSCKNDTGLVLGDDIDLRIFYQKWSHGFAVIEQTEQGPQRSLQFFDAEGAAIHKIFMKSRSDIKAYTQLIATHASSDQTTGIHIASSAARPLEQSDASVDTASFHQAWGSLRDVHDFFGLLKRFGLTRSQALRLAEPKFTHKVQTYSCQSLLRAVAISETPIMVFVGNSGVIQIHSGLIKKIAVMGPWVNVLDLGFNLHLREDHIASAWIVKKPTIDGLVTSLELFDAQGNTIAMFFGKRKPGEQELDQWRALIKNIQEEFT